MLRKVTFLGLMLLGTGAAGNPLLSNSLQMLRNLMRHGIQFKLLLPGVSPAPGCERIFWP